jgi:hypothetical protein
VKGLSPELLAEVALTPGEAIPLDRAWAIENGPGRFDPQSPRPLPKVNFLMLMRNERLATLETRLEPGTSTLVILRQGRQVARGDLATRLGRQMLEQFLAAYMKDALRGPPRIVSAPGHMFADVPVKCLHLVNLASVRDLERVAGRPIDPRRFRANLVLDGVPAWSEHDWVGQQIGAGATRLEVIDRTERCEAINVDPATGARDMGLPALLQRTWGHVDFGVYARVAVGGILRIGDIIGPP